LNACSSRCVDDNSRLFHFSNAASLSWSVYTRQELRDKFHIRDATIRNGVFRPKGHESIWIFVTEEKSEDMTDYKDELRGNELFIDGQSAGRTDKMLVSVVRTFEISLAPGPSYSFSFSSSVD
jgi:hypothetical protein